MPLLGSLREFRRDQLGFYTRCAREHGDVVPVRFGPTRGLLIYHPDAIEDVLVTRSRDFTKTRGIRMLRALIGDGLVLSEGDFYGTGAIAAAILALGPLGRIGTERFWYKPPFAWLLPLPGFDSTRVPALFSAVSVLCLAVLTAWATARLVPFPGRRSFWLTAIVAAGIVLDGWTVLPVVDVPALIPMTSADLVIELPQANAVLDDVAAMYRAIDHGHPVVNGYSGYAPPHYLLLTEDLRRGCVESLDAVRGSRSLEVVIWRNRQGAAQLDAAMRRRWGSGA